MTCGLIARPSGAIPLLSAAMALVRSASVNFLIGSWIKSTLWMISMRSRESAWVVGAIPNLVMEMFLRNWQTAIKEQTKSLIV